MSKEDFISQVSEIVSREASSRGYKFLSAIIAQACVESGFGVSVLASKYHNFAICCHIICRNRVYTML